MSTKTCKQYGILYDFEKLDIHHSQELLERPTIEKLIFNFNFNLE